MAIRGQDTVCPDAYRSTRLTQKERTLESPHATPSSDLRRFDVERNLQLHAGLPALAEAIGSPRLGGELLRVAAP